MTHLATVQREYREIPLGLIDAPQLPSRASMDDEKLDELTIDIRAKGVLQPLLVAHVGERYEVLAGHRRWLAAQRAGLVAVPCAVYPTKEAAHEAVKWSENRFREDLNAAEEAIWFDELLELHCGGDVDRLCALLGAKRPYVEGRLLLKHGDPLVFQALEANTIKIGIAHRLNECTDEQTRRYYLDAAIRGGATVAVVSGWVQQWKLDTGHLPPSNGPVGSAQAPSPVPQTNYFTCICCGGTDHVYLMQPVNVHTHCKMAILDKLLEAYRGERA